PRRRRVGGASGHDSLVEAVNRISHGGSQYPPRIGSVLTNVEGIGRSPAPSPAQKRAPAPPPPLYPLPSLPSGRRRLTTVSLSRTQCYVLTSTRRTRLAHSTARPPHQR